MRISKSAAAAALSVIAVALMAILGIDVDQTEGQATAYRAARLPGTSVPNLSGVWQTLNTANYDLEPHAARSALAVVPGPRGGQVPAAPVLALGAIGGVPAGVGVVEGGTIPYQPSAAAKKQENAAHILTRDPEIKCYLPGVPRATYLPYPFQIVQGTNKIKIAHEFATANRTIHLDDVGPAPVHSWMGHSVGKWEGETLVVTVTDQYEKFLDRSGNFHSDALRVVERFTPIGPDHLRYEATLEDPQTYTRPWTISMPLYRRKEATAQLLEYKCVEFVEELMFGHVRKEQLVKRWTADYGEEFGGRMTINVTRER